MLYDLVRFPIYRSVYSLFYYCRHMWFSIDFVYWFTVYFSDMTRICCVHFDLDLRDMTLGQGHDTFLGLDHPCLKQTYWEYCWSNTGPPPTPTNSNLQPLFWCTLVSSRKVLKTNFEQRAITHEKVGKLWRKSNLICNSSYGSFLSSIIEICESIAEKVQKTNFEIKLIKK